MKRLWTAAAILILLLAGTLVNARYVRSLTGEITDQLKQAQVLAQQEQWDQAAQLTRQAYQDWQDRHFYLHAILRHSDTNEILKAFEAVFQFLDSRETAQYAASNADLIVQLELLAEMERATLANVL